MGREIRMVPKDWQHPKDEGTNRFKPLHDGNFAVQAAEWDEGNAKWTEGLKGSYGGGWKPREDEDGEFFEDWEGMRPDPRDYMPNWPREQRTHLMMYETTSEGTPISPAFETPEGLARWLTDNGASSFGSMTATYEQWLATCKGGWAPSMVVDSKGPRSGVEAMADMGKEK